MKLIECYIESFGKIKNKRIDFSEGLNCILDNNGAGKTTLAVFIKVMLYGMSDTKRTSLEENDRKHYLPWDAGAARGTLTFETQGKSYRIERGFAPKAADDTFTLYDLSTGKVSGDFSEGLGEELFGIDADGFERTVFLSERALTPKSENKSVSAKLSDLVGCDGDIGVMDDAMKALEDGRKFYFKKGGSGELANIKNRISETRERLERLSEIEGMLESAEKKSAALKLELDSLNAKKAELSKEREAAALTSARAELYQRYEELLGEISTLKSKRGELLTLFGEKIPTHEEINDAAIKLREAERLRAEAVSGGENPEYRELREFFGCRCSEEEATEVRRALFEVKRKRERAASAESVKISHRFSKRIPTATELDELILLAGKLNGKAKGAPKLPLILAGALMIAAGGCLGIFVNAALLALGLIGGVMIALAFIGKKAGEDAKFAQFYYSISDIAMPTEDRLLSDLIEIRSLIDRAVALRKDSEVGYAETVVMNFAQKFGNLQNDYADFAENILAKFESFKSLSERESYRLSESKKTVERAEKLITETNAFTARYPFAAASCEKIREKLSEYERVCADLTAKEREAEKFALQYGNGLKDEKKPGRSAEDIKNEYDLVEAKIAELSREYTITEQASRRYADELEGRDEIAVSLSELEESFEKHSENYNVIIETKKFLEAAKDSMTAKYLGKTKSGFEKYTEMIGGISDDRFEMSTDFGVTKFEGASAKSTDAYSRGTKDLYNLAARLALVDSLYEGEEPFIILDDPFIAFDDEKAAAALNLLKKLGEEKQIIYFTCSESRCV